MLQVVELTWQAVVRFKILLSVGFWQVGMGSVKSMVQPVFLEAIADLLMKFFQTLSTHLEQHLEIRDSWSPFQPAVQQYVFNNAT